MYLITYESYFAPGTFWWHVCESEEAAKKRVRKAVRQAPMVQSSDFQIREMSGAEEDLFLRTCKRLQDLVEEGSDRAHILYYLEKEELLSLGWRVVMNYLVDKGEMPETARQVVLPA